MSHRNARLTVHGRRLLVDRVCSGRPVAHVAAEMGISRPTAHKWLRRWRSEGESGLIDRSSRPHRTPHRTSAATEARICRLRQDRKLGPARLGPVLGMPASTVHRVLTRHGLNRLAFLDRPTGRLIRRYEREHPGELIHIDVKKLGRIPDGGGHRTGPPGRPRHPQQRRFRLRPLRRRRPLPPRLQRNPPGREGHHLRGLPHSRGRVLPPPGHHPHRTRPHRQRLGLSQGPRLEERPGRPRRDRKADPPLPAPDQRQSRTLQPHPRRRMGLPAALHLQHRAHGSPGRLHPHLQPPPLPHRTRRPAPDQPSQQPCGSIHLARLRHLCQGSW